MGVKSLWSILDPICKEKSVGELHGKTLAIDLSCWVCDSQTLPSQVAKPHLRNLFFRTASLLENGIQPVYVLEGKAPEMKLQVMQKRNGSRFGCSQSQSQNGNRSRYAVIQKECIQMLNSLGISTVSSSGEAEATCAALNQSGVVDGCVTEDSDAFLYGARTVYRNLSTDLSHFTCKEYSMGLIESRLNLSRDKLIVLAILLGCDYFPEGVLGIGKETAIKILNRWSNGSAIELIKSWLFEQMDNVFIPPRPSHCSQCKHPGSLRAHTKGGCSDCCLHAGCRSARDDTECQCDWHRNEIRYEELQLRAKVEKLDGQFIQDVIEEFWNGKSCCQGTSTFKWQMPNIEQFIAIAQKKLKWETAYAVEKILPVFSRWVVTFTNERGNNPERMLIRPLRIIKQRVKRGTPVFQIEWQFDKELEHFPATFQTYEPVRLVEKNFSQLLSTVPQKPSKKSKKAVKLQKNESSRKKSEEDIMAMFQKMTLKSRSAAVESANKTVAPEEKSFTEIDLTESNDDSDLSVIVEMICRRKRCNRVDDQENVPEDADQNGVHCFSGVVANFSLQLSFDKTKMNEDSATASENASGDLLLKTPDRSAAEDLFSTPPPLAERLQRLNI